MHADSCMQGLGQHSKAVADLQAATDIKPGDDEVRKALAPIQDTNYVRTAVRSGDTRDVIASHCAMFDERVRRPCTSAAHVSGWCKVPWGGA